MAETRLSPLNSNVPIVDPDTGTPSPGFAGDWNTLIEEKGETQDTADAAAPGTRQVIAGAGLTGGGDLTADRTLNVGAGTGITVNADDVAIDTTAEAERIRDVIGAALVAGSNVTITVNDAGDTITIAASGGGGGGGSTPTVRASNIQASSNSSYTVTWPTGTVAGDVVVIFVGHGWAINTPSGWTSLDTSSGSNWNGACFAKEMTSADITAGSVTVTCGGAYDGVLAAVTITGTSVASYVSKGVTRSSTGATSASTSSATLVNDSDLCLVFFSNRANNTADVTNPGAVSLQTISSANASGCVESVSGDASVFGFIGTGTFSSSGTGYYVIAVAFRGP